LLHANPGDSQDFAAIIPILARNYRVLALDWPGYGQSSTLSSLEDTSVLFFYRVLREFMASLDLPSAHFIGNSVGGSVAARLASEVPAAVRALVLVAPGGFTPHTWFTRAFCRLQGSRFSLSPRRLAGFYLKQRTTTTAAMLQRAAGEQASPACVALNRALWRGFPLPVNDLRPAAQRIKAPTMLMFGAHDPVIPANKDGREAYRCLPGAQLVILPTGHAPFAELPEQFLAWVEPFLASYT